MLSPLELLSAASTRMGHHSPQIRYDSQVSDKNIHLTKQTCPSEILYLYLLHNQYITL